MYMYTAGIVHSSAAAYTSKASAGTQADNASAICQLVRVPSKRGTSYHTKRYTRILFFHSNTHPLFSPFFPLHWFQNAASRPLNACFVRKQNEVTENKAPPSRPHKETKYAEEKQNVRCFCMVGSTCPLPAPPTHTHRQVTVLVLGARYVHVQPGCHWGMVGEIHRRMEGGGHRLLFQASCSPQWVAG